MNLSIARALIAAVLLSPGLAVLLPAGSPAAFWALLASMSVLLWLWAPVSAGPLPLRRLPMSLAGAMAAATLLLWGLREWGWGADASLRLLLWAMLVAGLFRLPALRRLQLQADADDLWLLGLAAALGAVVLAPIGGDYRLMNGSHGLWHTASAFWTLERVPPENPVFAGAPGFLYWGYDLLIGHMGLALGRTPAEAAQVLNALAIWPLLAGAYELGGVFVKSRFWRHMSAFICACGLNGFAIGWLVIRLLAGRAPVSEYLAGDRLSVWALKYNWLNLNVPLEGHGEVGGAGLGLTLFVVGVVCIFDGLRTTGQRWHALLLALCVAGGLLLHPSSGGMIVPIGFAALTLRSLQRDRATILRQVLRLLAGLVIGTALGGWHVLQLQGGFEVTNSSDLAPGATVPTNRLWDLVGPWLWAWPFAALGMVSWLRRRHWAGYAAAASTLLLMICALLVPLPYGNYYKFTVLLSPFIGACVALAGETIGCHARVGRSSRSAPPGQQSADETSASGDASSAGRFRRSLSGLLGVAIILLLSLSLLASAAARARSAKYAGHFHFGRQGPEVVAGPDLPAPSLAMYQFIRTSTPPNAVIIECPIRLQQNTELLEVPILARRQLWTAASNYWMSGAYRDCAEREALACGMYSGKEPSLRQWNMLEALDRPIYLLMRQGHPLWRPDALGLVKRQPEQFTEVFAAPGLTLYRLHMPVRVKRGMGHG